MTSSKPNYLPIVMSPNTTALGVNRRTCGGWTYELVDDTVLSIAVGRMVPVTTSQLCCCSTRATRKKISMLKFEFYEFSYENLS